MFFWSAQTVKGLVQTKCSQTYSHSALEVAVSYKYSFVLFGWSTASFITLYQIQKWNLYMTPECEPDLTAVFITLDIQTSEDCRVSRSGREGYGWWPTQTINHEANSIWVAQVLYGWEYTSVSESEGEQHACTCGREWGRVCESELAKGHELEAGSSGFQPCP